MDLLDKLKVVEKRRAIFASEADRRGETVIERVLGPCEVVINGRPTLMFGSNNYLGLTLERASCSAAHSAEHITRALDIFARVGVSLSV